MPIEISGSCLGQVIIFGYLSVPFHDFCGVVGSLVGWLNVAVLSMLDSCLMLGMLRWELTRLLGGLRLRNQDMVRPLMIYGGFRNSELGE